MPDIFSVKDKVAIITGGMGQLGRQYTAALLEGGARVAVWDISIKNKNNYLIFREPNMRLKLYKTDITKRAAIRRSLGRTIKDFGKPDILINNAALDTPPDSSGKENISFEAYPGESWDKVLTVNLKGMFLTSQVVGGFMAESGGGSIINISSVYGNVAPDQRIYEYRAKKGRPFFKPVSYSVSKAGVINLTRCLATYWAKDKVRVNTLSLGGVLNKQDKHFIKEYSRRVPLGRMAKEDEYNGAILFLASEASGYMTGSNIIIDGGLTAW